MRPFVDLLIVLLLIAATCLGTLARAPVAEFGSSKELSEFLASRGYVLRQGRTPEEPNFSFFFSDHGLEDDESELLPICADCGLTPKWKGIVRVDQIHSSIGDLDIASISGKTRIWGNVLLAGDDRLMQRVLEDIRECALPAGFGERPIRKSNRSLLSRGFGA